MDCEKLTFQNETVCQINPVKPDTLDNFRQNIKGNLKMFAYVFFFVFDTSGFYGSYSQNTEKIILKPKLSKNMQFDEVSDIYMDKIDEILITLSKKKTT